MLSKAGLEILDVLCSGREATVQEFATETEHSRKQLWPMTV